MICAQLFNKVMSTDFFISPFYLTVIPMLNVHGFQYTPFLTVVCLRHTITPFFDWGLCLSEVMWGHYSEKRPTGFIWKAYSTNPSIWNLSPVEAAPWTLLHSPRSLPFWLSKWLNRNSIGAHTQQIHGSPSRLRWYGYIGKRPRE